MRRTTSLEGDLPGQGPGPEPGAMRPAEAPPARPVRGISLVHLMVLVLMCGLLFRFAIVAGPLLLFLSILLVPAMIIALAVAFGSRRSTQQDALLWVLAIAAERGMPLAPGLVAVADQYGGRHRRRVLALADWLDAGRSLPEALRGVPGVVPRPAMALIGVGWRVGALPQGLRSAAEARAARPPGRHPLVARIGYLVGMLLAMQVIIAFLLYFITPKMEAIFADFGIELPEATVYVIVLSHFLTESLLLPVAVLVEFATLVYLAFIFCGWAGWRIPFVDRLARRRHSAVILRGLAIVVEAGKPLASGIEALVESYPEPWVRRRLARVRRWINEGADCWDALRAQGLIRPAEAAVLASAQRAGNLAWALRELADAGERRSVYRLQAWAQALFPLVVLGLGGLVFLLAVAFFSPLVNLIEALAQ